MSLAILFPGQGSQHIGMGLSLAKDYPEATRIFEEANEILGFNLSKLAWEGPEDKLVLTKNAQPAILVHSVAVYRVIRDRLGEVAMASGHSLGEFSAHVAAGTLDFEQALRTVRLRGELMCSAGASRSGTMAAVIGMTDREVELVCTRANNEVGTCVPANFNSEGQVVISGDVLGVERAMELAERMGARRVVLLNVSGAFHSPLMAPAEEEFRGWLDKMHFCNPEFPVIANVTAEPVSTADTARLLLVQQLTSPVRWVDSIGRMISLGADRFLELGPGSVLRALNRRNAKKLPCESLGESLDIETWEG